jgi:hypothetical protein
MEAPTVATKQVSFQGLDLIVETPKGGERRGTSAAGEPWTVTMPADYGYIRKTIGADGEGVDFYLGPDPEADRVWIVHQNDVQTGAFDEHKVMLGFADRASAITTYVAGFSDGRGIERIGKVTPTTIAGLKQALASDEACAYEASVELTDHQTAEAIRDGDLPSPTRYGDFWLFDLRITGTGAAYRDALDEYAIRDPEEWLSDEFVARCAGLPVIFGHPERSGLNQEEWRQRAIGTIVLPYLKGDEVWGVAKIYDADAAELMQTTHRSTSPGVTPPKGASPVTLNDGTKVLAEPLPAVLDHLAVCQAGVWDKDGPPDGIRLDARKDQAVADEDREKLEKAEKERDDARRDAADFKARLDAKEAEEKERADKARKDAETEAEAEKEKADKKRADRKGRHDKHDGDIMDCSRCDSEEEEEREDKKRKDAAATAAIDANRGTELHDSKKITDLEAELRDLKARLGGLERQPSIEERNEISAAFHRADSVYQMLGDETPHAIAGETPIAYRRRLADKLRKYSEKWKTYAFHDALDPQAFKLVEDSIYADALDHAKTPSAAGEFGQLREVKSKELGKEVSRFFGDARSAWLPFMQPSRTVIGKINNNPAGSR